MPKVTCNKCNTDYEFKKSWFNNHDCETFICRKCKIRIRTQSESYKNKQRQLSIKSLSDPNVKERMSQKAILNNIKNADQISKSVKKYYSNHDNLQKAKQRSKNNWLNSNYRKMVSEGLKEKWRDPKYRGKVLGSRVRLHQKNNKLKNKLSKLNIEHIIGHAVPPYEFDALIKNKYLFDYNYSKEKELFIEHYYKDFIYTNDLNYAIINGPAED